ncbi:IS5 family transposase [Streptomyces canus]|uniref:IS5 family transposase n=1 Tax=Streptomyces canus TaxID=58343 RepID=UPI0033A76B69
MGNRQPRSWIVPDELWSLIKPLVPVPAPKLVEGRPRVPDRQALCGILSVLHTGIQWECLPQELGFGSGMTCWRRLAAWHEAGVWNRLHAVLLKELRSKTQLDWSRAVIGSSPIRGSAGPKSGPSPVDRARPGSKQHVLTNGQGIPLAVSLTGGNRNDVTQLLPLLDKVPAIAGQAGRPRRRPDALLAERGYHHDKYRRLLWQRGIRPVIAERGQPYGSGLGMFRYVVKRTISWLHGFRRLPIRWERRDDIHEAFVGIAVCLITHRHVQRLCQGQSGM